MRVPFSNTACGLLAVASGCHRRPPELCGIGGDPNAPETPIRGFDGFVPSVCPTDVPIVGKTSQVSRVSCDLCHHPADPLKVATRVRIPLGLLRKNRCSRAVLRTQ